MSMRDSVKSLIEAGEKPSSLKQHSQGQVDGAYRDFFYKGKIYVGIDTVVETLDDMNQLLAASSEEELEGAFDYNTGEHLAGGLINYLEIMPDINTYDGNGDIISTSRPTILADVHHIAGQAARIFN